MLCSNECRVVRRRCPADDTMGCSSAGRDEKGKEGKDEDKGVDGFGIKREQEDKRGRGRAQCSRKGSGS